MPSTNPFAQPLAAKRVELDQARARLDGLKKLKELLSVPMVAGVASGIQAQITALAGLVGVSASREWLEDNIGRLITEQGNTVAALIRQVAQLEADFAKFEDKAAQLMEGGASQQEAYAQLNSQADAKALAIQILQWTGIAALTALAIWGLVKLIKRMRAK